MSKWAYQNLVCYLCFSEHGFPSGFWVSCNMMEGASSNPPPLHMLKSHKYMKVNTELAGCPCICWHRKPKLMWLSSSRSLQLKANVCVLAAVVNAYKSLAFSNRKKTKLKLNFHFFANYFTLESQLLADQCHYQPFTLNFTIIWHCGQGCVPQEMHFWLFLVAH